MKQLRMFVVLLAIAMLYLMIGCANDNNSNNNNPTDTTSAELRVLQANSALETVLNNLINQPNDPQRPSGIDLHVPYNLYMQALALNPNNRAANFGAGILELVMLSQDSATNHQFDIWKQFGDSGQPFIIPGMSVFSRVPSGVKPVLSYSDLAMPFFPGLKTVRDMTDVNSIQSVDPQFSQAQNYFINVVVPKIDIMIPRLQIVAADPTFTFTVTPLMQGNSREDPVIIDATVIHATLAGLQALKANFLQMAAYSFDLSGYTGAGMQAALTQGSSFAALRTNGATNLATARTCWLSASTALDSAIYRLEHPIGSQNYHLIKIDPQNGVTQAQLDSMKVYLPKLRNLLNTSERFMVDADGDSTTPKVNLEVSLRAMFMNPVQDLKALLPAYTVTLDTGVQTEHNWLHNVTSSNVTFNQSMYFWYSRSANFENGALVSSDSDFAFSVPDFDIFWNNKVQQYRNYKSAHLSMWTGYNYYAAGINNVQATFEVDYEFVKHYRYQPVITWNATSFTDWTMPNPTMGGMLPGITTSDQFKTTFGFRAADWQRRNVLKMW